MALQGKLDGAEKVRSVLLAFLAVFSSGLALPSSS